MTVQDWLEKIYTDAQEAKIETGEEPEYFLLTSLINTISLNSNEESYKSHKIAFSAIREMISREEEANEFLYNNGHIK